MRQKPSKLNRVIRPYLNRGSHWLPCRPDIITKIWKDLCLSQFFLTHCLPQNFIHYFWNQTAPWRCQHFSPCSGESLDEVQGGNFQPEKERVAGSPSCAVLTEIPGSARMSSGVREHTSVWYWILYFVTSVGVMFTDVLCGEWLAGQHVTTSMK